MKALCVSNIGTDGCVIKNLEEGKLYSVKDRYQPAGTKGKDYYLLGNDIGFVLKTNFNLVKMTMSDEMFNDLWLLVKFIEQKNVFNYITRKDMEFIGLYISHNEDGDIDYDNGVNYIEYHTSLDAIAPIVKKLMPILSELPLPRNPIKIGKILSDLNSAFKTFDPEIVFKAVVNGVKYIK